MECKDKVRGNCKNKSTDVYWGEEANHGGGDMDDDVTGGGLERVGYLGSLLPTRRSQ